MVLFSLRPWFLQEIDGFPNGIYFFQTRWFLFKEDGPSWSLKVGKLKLKVVVPFGLRFLIRFFGGAAPGCGGGIFQPVETAHAASLCTEHTVQNHHLEASLKLFIHYNRNVESLGILILEKNIYKKFECLLNFTLILFQVSKEN